MMHDADDRLERLIDRASSSLTEAETSPAFVTRVMAILDAPPRRAATPWTLVAPAAACLAVLLALGGWWTGRQRAASDVSRTQAVTSRDVPAATAAVPASTSAPAVSGTPPATAPTAIPRRMRQGIGRKPAQVPAFDAIAIAHVEIAPVVTDEDGLELPPVGALPPIAVDDVAIDPIEVTRQPRAADTPQSQGGRQ